MAEPQINAPGDVQTGEHLGAATENQRGIEKNIDTGLSCLVMVAKFHGIAAEPAQLRHAYAIGATGMNTIDILRAAKELGMKAKAARVKFEKLAKLRLPAIIKTVDKQFIILAKAEQDKVLILHPVENRPKILNKTEFLALWEGKIILFTHRGTLNKEQGFGIKWFIPAVWKYRRPLAEALIASFILQVFVLISPIFTQVIIDKVLVHRGLTTLDVLVIGLVAIGIFEAVLGIARNYVFIHTTSKIDVTLGARLFKHLMVLPLRYFEVRRVGDTIARVRELENIRQFLTGAPLTSMLDVMFITVFLGVMFFYSTTLTFVVLGALPFYIVLSAIMIPMLKHRLDERFNKGAELQSYLVEAVTGVQTVKSFALEPEAQKKWEGYLAGYVKASLKTANLAGVAGALGQLIQRLSYLLILWLGAHLVMDSKLTVGQLIAFQMLSSRVSDPVLRLVKMWQDFQQTGLSIQRLGDIFNTTPEQAVNPTKARLPAIRGHVRFEGVTFRYRIDGPEVIKNMSFDIKPGMIIGVVGRSGSGKSTLAKLIQRLYIPEAGKITVDGVDISLADPAWLRRQIGVVLQESFLFNSSVRDNIAIHYPSASMADVVRVARLAGAHDFILQLPEGYDTMVGEKGTALSGGQRQRIAIARALLMNPRLLIFDEATSALDYESESIIQRNLQNICQGRTVFIIAHRLSTLRPAHKIMVIDGGRIVEVGTHDELMGRKGLYNYLYTQQERGL